MIKKSNIEIAFDHVADEWKDLYYLREHGYNGIELDTQRARAMEGIHVLELMTGKGLYYNISENAIKEV